MTSSDLSKRTNLVVQELNNFRLAWHLFWDPRVSVLVKLIPVGAVMYVLSPWDLIPDAIPVLGELDDIAIVLIAIHLMVHFSPPAVVRAVKIALGIEKVADGEQVVVLQSKPPSVPRIAGGFCLGIMGVLAMLTMCAMLALASFLFWSYSLPPASRDALQSVSVATKLPVSTLTPMPTPTVTQTPTGVCVRLIGSGQKTAKAGARLWYYEGGVPYEFPSSVTAFSGSETLTGAESDGLCQTSRFSSTLGQLWYKPGTPQVSITPTATK